MPWRGNYLEDVPNPWGLAGPPAWFCAELYAFDAQLVIFPSAESSVYRVARRTADEGAIPLLTPAGERPHGEYRPDQRVYVTRKLVPITSLLPFTRWSPVVLKDLAAISFERNGGWKAAADRLDEHDEYVRRKQDETTYDGATSLAHTSWWGAQFSTGGAVDLGSAKPEGARTANARRRQPVYRPPNFAGSAVFVGTPARTAGSPRVGKPWVAPDVFVGKTSGPSRTTGLWTP